MKRFPALFIMLMLCGTLAFAQNRDITGKVVDSKDGSPLPKISVKIKGTDKGTSTNPDGTFSLESNKEVTLEFSGVGFVPTTIKASPGEKVNINLEQEVKSLNEGCSNSPGY